MDERLKKRISNLSSCKKENLIEDCQERMLSLRKQKLEKHFESKRMLNFNPFSRYEILIEDITIENSPFNDFQTEFSINVNVHLTKGLTKRIVDGIYGNNEEVKSSVYFIRRHHQSNNEDLSNLCRNKEFVDQLLKLFRLGDLKLQVGKI